MVCKCGMADPSALILMRKIRGTDHGTPPTSKSARYRDDRALLASYDIDDYFARCYNCQQQLHGRGPGRPLKYKTPEDQKWQKENKNKMYFANLGMKVLMSYGIRGEWPSCTTCDQPATRVLYIGEFGKAPTPAHYWRCRRLAITDPYWHAQFTPYCDYHQAMPINERRLERNRLNLIRELDAMYKSTRTFADLVAAGEV